MDRMSLADLVNELTNILNIRGREDCNILVDVNSGEYEVCIYGVSVLDDQNCVVLYDSPWSDCSPKDAPWHDPA